jgi:hypothetical protein
MDSTSFVPIGFDERHFTLGEANDIVREQFVFVRDVPTLRLRANQFEVPKYETDAYGEFTWGVAVQDVLASNFGFSSFILLRGPLTPEVHRETYSRLEHQGLDPSPRIADEHEPSLLYALIMLHEVAHICLGHGRTESATESERNEREADKWAWTELKRSWHLFPAVAGR